MMFDFFIALVPLLPAVVYLLLSNYAGLILTKIGVAIWIAITAYISTIHLIPVFAEYTLKKGLSGKDLGKKGSPQENNDIPEALGIVCGIIYLVSTILSQLSYANSAQQMIIFNSALFSICFMIFLGYLDDTLDLKWRYKLILPTVASLPLLASYSGSTAMYIPNPFATYLMQNGQLTLLGQLINVLFIVDTEAHGKIIELGWWFLLFMGLQAVFCTNAINILAGINGLECGQAYVIAASLLFFKVYEISEKGKVGDDELFAIVLLLPYIGTTLGLLKFNWYPSSVFVGDTFCYFSGMTFAVIGIHSHFSKTLLILFIPQIINFLYSIPQLFKFVPCPRHRLPKKLADRDVLTYSTFPCAANEYRFFKVKKDDTEGPNCTLINLFLRIFGPMHEKTLTISLLAFQMICSGIAFYIRYILLEQY
jgi:UDP-N-acetylglucosamine--dolichyl-phosphate N-acetylglucosaminephosphotransferase